MHVHHALPCERCLSTESRTDPLQGPATLSLLVTSTGQDLSRAILLLQRVPASTSRSVPTSSLGRFRGYWRLQQRRPAVRFQPPVRDGSAAHGDAGGCRGPWMGLLRGLMYRACLGTARPDWTSPLSAASGGTCFLVNVLVLCNG